MATYRCPVCKKPLTKNEYETALGILEAREQHLHGETKKLSDKLAAAHRKLKNARHEGLRAGRDEERKRTRRLVAGYDRKMEAMRQRIKQIERGTTPQTEGLEFEDELAARLRREFPQDLIIPKGKGGDVLQLVRFEQKEIGRIIFECKRTSRISGQHIHQAALAKQSREADFSVVVTTGKRKGFGGLADVRGVLVVAPLGVIPLVSLLRTNLIEIVKANILREKRTLVAQKLLKFITSAQFRNPIEETVRLSLELQDMIIDEAKVHYRVWQKRWDHYQRMQWDSTQIGNNVQSVLQGKEPKAILRPKGPPLQLPHPSEKALAAKTGE